MSQASLMPLSGSFSSLRLCRYPSGNNETAANSIPQRYTEGAYNANQTIQYGSNTSKNPGSNNKAPKVNNVSDFFKRYTDEISIGLLIIGFLSVITGAYVSWSNSWIETPLSGSFALIAVISMFSFIGFRYKVQLEFVERYPKEAEQ